MALEGILFIKALQNALQNAVQYSYTLLRGDKCTSILSLI
jgi:hypothetical protein